MLDSATASIIETIAAVGGIAGVIAFLMWIRSERDAERRQRLLEAESAANRELATQERSAYGSLVSKVIEVVEANSRASEAIRQTMANVCSALGAHDARSIETSAAAERIESKVDETLLKVEGVDEKVVKLHGTVSGLDTYVRGKLG